MFEEAEEILWSKLETAPPMLAVSDARMHDSSESEEDGFLRQGSLYIHNDEEETALWIKNLQQNDASTTAEGFFPPGQPEMPVNEEEETMKEEAGEHHEECTKGQCIVRKSITRLLAHAKHKDNDQERPNAEEKQEIEANKAMMGEEWLELAGQVTIFTISGCKFCKATTKLLKSAGIPVTAINLDLFPEAQQQMKDLCGKHTVPQVFFNEVCLILILLLSAIEMLISTPILDPHRWVFGVEGVDD